MIRWLVAWLLLAGTAMAQTPSGTATLTQRGGMTEIALGLEALAPYRVFTLDAPRRLIVDLAGPLPPQDAVDALQGGMVIEAQVTRLRPGWTRLIVRLAEPAVVAEAVVREVSDAAVLTVKLRPSDVAEFARRSGAPPDAEWAATSRYDPQTAAEVAAGGLFVVVIDAAYGGAEDGGVANGIRVSDLALVMAQELAARLNGQSGIRAVLTRDGDVETSLTDRLEGASTAGADLLIALSAEVLSDAEVGGVAVAVFEGGDSADEAKGAVAAVLGDLARAQTRPEAARVADAFLAEMGRSGVPLRAANRQTRDWPVMAGETYPSVAVSLGNLARADDRVYLVSPDGRNAISDAITEVVRLLAR